MRNIKLYFDAFLLKFLSVFHMFQAICAKIFQSQQFKCYFHKKSCFRNNLPKNIVVWWHSWSCCLFSSWGCCRRVLPMILGCCTRGLPIILFTLISGTGRFRSRTNVSMATSLGPNSHSSYAWLALYLSYRLAETQKILTYIITCLP